MLMCGVGAKSVAHLMKFHLLQWEVVKVKFLMNPNMTLTVLNLHQKTDPKMQQDFKGQGHYDKDQLPTPTKYQLPTPYGLKNIAWTRHYRSRALWQDQRSNQGHTMTFYIYTP